MNTRTITSLVLVLLAVSACRREPEPEPVPMPAPMPTVNQDSIDAARRAREAAEREAADRARREAEERARAEAEARARAAAEAARRAFSTAIYFDYDRSELKPEARAALDSKIPLLRANTAVRIRIAGHADERGSDSYNMGLSQRRAASAKAYLVSQGIAADRIETVGFGEERPAAMGSDENAWAQNRRDEFEIIVGGENLRLP
jgi:peptidoglycan-associated lipoprotein